jgi:Co/Zn/Cd efflux system component
VPRQHLQQCHATVLALLVNVRVALLLYTFRNGDANMRSVWPCSRNDAFGYTAVSLIAAPNAPLR